MKVNSEKAKSGENLKELHDRNANLVKNYKLPYYYKDGTWYMNGVGTPVYAQGGIADYTGYAWVDGTKTKPERILSASQTDSFNKLVGILPKLNLGENNTNTKSENENIYVNTINVTTNDATSFINNLKKVVYKRGV
jgi:hypothetical protein